MYKNIITDICESTSLNRQRGKGKKKKKRDQDSTIQTLYQYGTASSTVLLGTMLVRAARRARSRLHMGQEEILGVFNHVFCSRKKKKSREFLIFISWVRE